MIRGDSMLRQVISTVAVITYFPLAMPVSAGELVDEVRFGASASIESARSNDHGLIGSAEIYVAPFSSPRTGVAKILLEPRLQIGVSGGAGAIDQVYTGLNWHLPLTDNVFAELGAGGTLHNGNLVV
jgi:lipid A 3-O-deacylase